MNKIYLVGYMGSGKTTVGRRLAGILGMQFVDIDHFIENRHRQTIGQLFAEKGEDYFRELEHKSLLEIVDFENMVISTGGGLPCFYDNMEIMNQSGITIYLKVSVEELAKRLNTCKQSRPLIKEKNPQELKDYIAVNLEKREPSYKQSKLILDAEKLLTQTEADDIANLIVNLLKTKTQ